MAVRNLSDKFLVLSNIDPLVTRIFDDSLEESASAQGDRDAHPWVPACAQPELQLVSSALRILPFGQLIAPRCVMLRTAQLVWFGPITDRGNHPVGPRQASS
jgi:hypothetical protein